MKIGILLVCCTNNGAFDATNQASISFETAEPEDIMYEGGDNYFK